MSELNQKYAAAAKVGDATWALERAIQVAFERHGELTVALAQAPSALGAGLTFAQDAYQDASSILQGLVDARGATGSMHLKFAGIQKQLAIPYTPPEDKEWPPKAAAAPLQAVA